METKSKIIFLGECVFILVWLLFVGQVNGHSAFSGDLNLIDEGQFAAWIQHISQGKVIYRDLYFQYGPLYLLPGLLFTKLFGMTFFSIRLGVDTFGVLLGLIVALVVMRFLNIEKKLYYITLSFLLLIPGIHIRHWVGVLALLLFIKAWKVKSYKLAFMLGLLLLIALLQSVEVGIFSISILTAVIIYLFITEENIKRVFQFTSATIFGFLGGYSIFAYIAITQNWYTSFVSSTVEVLTSLSGINLPNGQGLPPLASPFSKDMLFYISLAMLLVIFSTIIIRFLQKIATYKDAFMLLFVSFGLMSYFSIVGRSGHYFITVPFTMVGLVYFISLFKNSKEKIKYKNILYGLLLLFFVLYWLRHLLIFRFTAFSNLSSYANTRVFIPRVNPLSISSQQSLQITHLQNYIQKHSNISDTIFIVSNLPGYYFLLDRENATIYDLPLLINSQEKRKNTVSQLIAHKPTYIIEDSNAWEVDGVSDRQRLPEVFTFIKDNYKVKDLVDNFIIYEQIGQ